MLKCVYDVQRNTKRACKSWDFPRKEYNITGVTHHTKCVAQASRLCVCVRAMLKVFERERDRRKIPLGGLPACGSGE